jgi:hypothetical protein
MCLGVGLWGSCHFFVLDNARLLPAKAKAELCVVGLIMPGVAARRTSKAMTQDYTT